jgi:hypothetical protein
VRVDPDKLAGHSADVFRCLARITEAVIKSRDRYHIDPAVQNEAATAISLMFKIVVDD